jgi:transposase-like protein
MQIRKLMPMYNKNMERLIRASKFSKSEEAQFRLKVVDFSKKYGIKAAEDAFSVSRTTIFRWRKSLRDAHGCIDCLIPKSRRPKSVRQMRTDAEIISFIRDIREIHPHIGTEKIKPLLENYCMKIGIKPCLSFSHW